MTQTLSAWPQDQPVPLHIRARAELELRRRRRARALEAWTADPVSFAAACGLDLDPWQQRVLQSDAQLLLINASRQSGKSTIVATLALHTLLTRPGSLVVILAPAERQSKEMMRVVFRLYRAINRPVRYTSVTKTSIELENQSRLLAYPGKGETTRGIANVALLICEEATLIDDATYSALSPVLAVSQGRLVCLFTPHGKRGWTYGLWTSDPHAERIEVPATDCPRIPKEYLEQERRRLGDYWFEQEFFNKWQEPETAAFRESDILGAMSDDVHFDADLFRV